MTQTRMLLSGNEAVAHAALRAGVRLGSGYPGTPSTEILENFSALGGYARWAPNEKVALEVAIGAAFCDARAIATMKHVGLNVAADPLFTCAYTGVTGGLVVIVADDPGLASSQNEQDSRRYGIAAGVPVLEPADSQQAFDFFGEAMAISETFGTPVLFRMTTRVCHSKTVVELHDLPRSEKVPHFEHDIPKRVMIPAYARGAHGRLRTRLKALQDWNESSALHTETHKGSELGIISSGISALHAREAAPDASHLTLGMSYPLPIERIRAFAASVKRCVVIEEGDPVLSDALLAAGIAIEPRPEPFRFGELNVNRVRKILAHDQTPDPVPPKGRPPQLCLGCPHRAVFETLRDLDCIVSGDIGCYSLGVLPPFQSMDTLVCMGSSISSGLGMRHVLPEKEARRVVSVIGDSTFLHSGVTGLIEMVYNRPSTGHVVLILDNSTTAMTGLQEHPGTGRLLDHSNAHSVDYEALCRSLGIADVTVMDPTKDKDAFTTRLKEKLAATELSVIIARRPCILAVAQQAKRKQA